MANVNAWDKFLLLLWKNWILVWNHKLKLIGELFLPAVIPFFLVLIRALVTPEAMSGVSFEPVKISSLSLFNETISQKYPILKLVYSPENEYLENIVSAAAKSLNITYGTGSYATSSDLELALLTDDYLAGVQFDDSWASLTSYPKQFSFSLRFPAELRTSSMRSSMTWLTTNLFPELESPGARNPNQPDGGIPVGYLREGFLPIQNALSIAYLKLAAKTDDIPEIEMQRYPYPNYTSDPLIEGISWALPMSILLSFIHSCTQITKYVALEKEKQLKEVMKIMGLDNWLHWLAWFVKSFLMLAISTVLIVVLLTVRWSNNVAVLTYSSFSAIYVFLLVYIVTFICFCFMTAVFFSKANTAAAVTGLVCFIAYVPYSFISNFNSGLTLDAKLGWSLIFNTAMGFGIEVISDFESTGEGLQWSNFFSPPIADENLTMGSVVIAMLISCVIYMIICLYIEQIFPGDFGVPKKWNFPLTRKFWCGDKYIEIDLDVNGQDRSDPNAFETEPSRKHIGLQVKKLHKKFGNKVAVKKLSVNMYEDEITVLLGHNGAGKTTTISMLTGMFPPTSGTAIINGSDIRTNIEGARMSLGVCPQHNVLFDDMTVANHIVFFSRMKGLKGDDVQREVEKYLGMIELEGKANEVSSKLSGGQKRKLSVCCALCGGTKVVLCDEPSSGMDPAARRQLWDLLQSEKMGRTVLLTTHFMDEADVLGDRIAIMCDGELKCHGTSFFLKRKYGDGYHLICVKNKNCNIEKVTNLLRNYIPDIEPKSNIGSELSYQLSERFSSVFEVMLGELEERSDELNLDGYGIGVTSLEEVFIKVGAENYNYNSQTKQTSLNNSLTSSDCSDIDCESIFSDNSQHLSKTYLFVNQWIAMIIKKFLYTYRNVLLLLLQICMPILFVVVAILIIRIQSNFQDLKAMTINVTQYPTATVVLETDSDVELGSMQAKIADEYKIISNSYGNNYNFESTEGISMDNYILNLGKTKQVQINSRYVAAATIGKNKLIAWLNNQPLHTAPLTVNMLYNAIARVLLGSSAEIKVTNAPLPYATETFLSRMSSGNSPGTQLAINMTFCMCFVCAFYILFLIKERESRSKLLQFVGGVRIWIFWATQILWDYITYTITALVMIITLACFQEECVSTFSELGRYFLIFLIFGCSALPYTYIISFCFNEPASGFARVAILNLITGVVLFIVYLLLSFEAFNTKNVAITIGWIFRVFPHFSLAMGLNKLYLNEATRHACSHRILQLLPEIIRCQLAPSCCESHPYFAWDDSGVLPEITYMVGTSVIFSLFIMVKEYGIINELVYRLLQKFMKPSPPPKDGYFDVDVDFEKKRIFAMSSAELFTQNMVLDRVTKYYGNFVAVNEISLSVKENECFGLLGVNGAGKTSTFKMMTGDERITSGSAYIKGMSLKYEMNRIYREVGYCPQFDALLGDMTGRETLKIYCLLRGVKRDRIKTISEDLAKSFGFLKHMDKEIKNYSGGNKRKLSTAVAVIGNPSVIFLDEPTTGMDPVARRQLWNMVCRIRDSGKSVILTSHSMEECEALCTRLAIMVNGEFKCIGSTQHLKNKFSKGLILKIKTKRITELYRDDERIFYQNGKYSSVSSYHDSHSVKEFVQREFLNAVLQEEFQGILTYYIPLSSIKWSKMFGLMEHSRERLNIEDYSISQTTLEEIFLDLAKHQRESTREVSNSSGCCRRSRSKVLVINP